MKIQNKDMYHGSALTQIVEDPSFTALNKADDKYGHYQINHNKRILVKHSGQFSTPWHFTLQADDIDTIVEDVASDQESFLCLICGKESICVLSTEEFEHLIDTGDTSAQWIKVEFKAGAGMRVSGSNGSLKSVVPHSSFPRKLFEPEVKTVAA